MRAYGNAYAHTTYVFFGIDDAQRGRAWLRRLLGAGDDRRALDRRASPRRR